MSESLEPELDAILTSIFMVRGVRATLDSDLVLVYNVETKRLNEQVKRNVARFPEDFMFQLTRNEYQNHEQAYWFYLAG